MIYPQPGRESSRNSEIGPDEPFPRRSRPPGGFLFASPLVARDNCQIPAASPIMLSEAAAYLGLSRHQVRRLIKAGILIHCTDD